MPLASTYRFEAIGTQWSIDTNAPLTNDEIANLQRRIEDFDVTYSRFRDDSLVTSMSKNPGVDHTFPLNITDFLCIYGTLNKLSDGKINPLVGSSLERLGYDAKYRLSASEPAPAPALSALTLKDTTIVSSEPILLDVGAIGKGYLIDRLASELAAKHDEFVVDGSGDIAVQRSEPDVIGLEHPLDTSKIIGTVSLKSGSLCASATNRRAWGNGLHHIIDATTGKSADTSIIATWAVASSATVADALTTGLFFINPGLLQQEFGNFRYVIMYGNGSVKHNITAEVGELFV